MSLLELSQVSVNYGNITALRDVSLSIEEGDFIALIGANGAGKSTLLKAIAGIQPLSHGSINFKNQTIAIAANEANGKIKSLRADQIAALSLALVPEGRHVFKDMTIEENLDMGAFLVRDDALIARKKEEMYDFFPILGVRRKQKSRSLSGGEQQMLAIARAMMSSPTLLLLDEPGLGLAPLIVADIFSKLDYLNKKENITIFVVEQNARMALRFSSHAHVLETGSMILSGESDELLENPRVQKAYLGQ